MARRERVIVTVVVDVEEMDRPFYLQFGDSTGVVVVLRFFDTEPLSFCAVLCSWLC